MTSFRLNGFLIVVAIFGATNLARSQSNYATPYAFRVFAGQPGVSGSTGNTNTSLILLKNPTGVAIDSRGILFVTDSGNNAILVCSASSSGTLGLPGSAGNVDGDSSVVRFSRPAGLAIEKNDYVHVVDSASSTVRLISPFSSFIGTESGVAGQTGSTDGNGSSVRYNGPMGIAVDDSSRLYVADTGNNVIRKITGGNVSTFAGNLAGGSVDGTGVAASFRSPMGIVADSAGNLFVTDYSNHTIRKITAQGVVTTFAGAAGIAGSADGTGSSARFNFPSGIAIDRNGNLYVAEDGNSTIRKITPSGVVTTVAGTPGVTGTANGLGAAARFNHPRGVAIDGFGVIYVADELNHTIRIGYPNHAPQANNSAVATAVNVPVTFTPPASDPDGDVLLYAFNGVTGGTASYNGTQIIFTPFPGFSGTGTISYSATDGYASSTGVIAVTVGNMPPAIAQQPASQPRVSVGDSVSISVVAASNTPLAYQWYFNGVPIGGATSSTLTLKNTALSQTGNYQVVVANVAGAATSDIAALVVSDARLRALSTRAQVFGSYGDQLIPGFAVGGTGQCQVVLRACGPAIKNVSGVLAKPGLILNQFLIGALATNSGWSSGSPTSVADLQGAFSAVGLPQLPLGSADSAMLATFQAGKTYTAVVSGLDATTGVALLEAYELGTNPARMIALSCRAQVGRGDNILIAGVVISGTVPKRMLIRAAASTQGSSATGSLYRPHLELFVGGTKIAENIGWTTAANAEEVFAVTPSCGILNYPTGSSDSAILTTLSPGAYTIQVSGSDNSTGLALIEVYEVPAP